VTLSGKQIIANLYANVFRAEHETQAEVWSLTPPTEDSRWDFELFVVCWKVSLLRSCTKPWRLEIAAIQTKSACAD
jgi:hypothetical protein